MSVSYIMLPTDYYYTTVCMHISGAHLVYDGCITSHTQQIRLLRLMRAAATCNAACFEPGSTIAAELEPEHTCWGSTGCELRRRGQPYHAASCGLLQAAAGGSPSLMPPLAILIAARLLADSIPLQRLMQVLGRRQGDLQVALRALLAFSRLGLDEASNGLTTPIRRLACTGTSCRPPPRSHLAPPPCRRSIAKRALCGWQQILSPLGDALQPLSSNESSAPRWQMPPAAKMLVSALQRHHWALVHAGARARTTRCSESGFLSEACVASSGHVWPSDRGQLVLVARCGSLFGPAPISWTSSTVDDLSQVDRDVMMPIF